MLITEATCSRVDDTNTHFYYFDHPFETVLHISISNSRCICDPRPVRGDLVTLVRELSIPEGTFRLGWECIGVLEHRPDEGGIVVEVTDDIWNLHDQGYWVCVPTNGMRNSRGDAIMGKGIAKEAAERFPKLAEMLGRRLSTRGNVPHYFPGCGIVTFPTKDNWKHKSKLPLIIQSYCDITSGKATTLWPKQSKGGILCLPKLGCGNGGLEWGVVRRALLPHWNINTVVVSK